MQLELRSELLRERPNTPRIQRQALLHLVHPDSFETISEDGPSGWRFCAASWRAGVRRGTSTRTCGRRASEPSEKVASVLFGT